MSVIDPYNTGKEVPHARLSFELGLTFCNSELQAKKCYSSLVLVGPAQPRTSMNLCSRSAFVQSHIRESSTVDVSFTLRSGFRLQC
jgi:hypothetical protein